MSTSLVTVAFHTTALWVPGALAQDPPEPEEEVVVGAYVEAFASHNFNAPDNGVTNLRGFDDRSDAITLSNVAVDVAGKNGDVSGKLVLQVGHTPNTYYLAEPGKPAVGSAGESDARSWRMVQQAWGAWQASEKTSFEAGLFLSPIGPESIVARDDWNFSRSNLFFGLPFYHTGARVNFAPTEPLKLTGSVYNGWNSVLDNNTDKSVSAQAVFTKAPLTASLLYFGGVERPEGAPEGQPWRHLVDAYVQIDPTDRVSFLVHGDVGLEPNAFGTSSWQAGAVYARVRPIDPLYLAARGDWFREVVASDADGTAGAIFWPAFEDDVARVASATLTVDWRPVEDGLSLRVEGRHDDANTDMYFAGDVDMDTSGAPILDASQQNTVTVAVITWF